MRSAIKWYTGGQERGKAALELLTQLRQQVDGAEYVALQEILASYFKEIKTETGSIPLILSRMNLDISRVMINNHIVLPSDAQKTLKKLTELSQIRYGY
ncbi:bacteriocin immunity protein [Leuconostoc kimchii]|uniref:Immunity protein n=2 Tax=Leuconostoc kimchii TaxID=136609 RepID=D5T1V5_LEUKI|nr:bacteriocin immunity protein [Leuconostoc kimchii]ADG40254.1 immunity protein [Leuconostoc kimchii IMSNU 11154]QBR46764.1 bacteriocin immunity protein [Leuconostoc kimchii]